MAVWCGVEYFPTHTTPITHVYLYMQVIGDHPGVAEVAVVGIQDQLKGQLPLGLIVRHGNCTLPEEQLTKELVQAVRHRIGALTCFREAKFVKRLPKTRSGKILRGTIRSMANKTSYRYPATIDDPAALEEMEELFKNY
jgi:propionyl-CoA synthetase